MRRTKPRAKAGSNAWYWSASLLAARAVPQTLQVLGDPALQAWLGFLRATVTFCRAGYWQALGDARNGLSIIALPRSLLL